MYWCSCRELYHIYNMERQNLKTREELEVIAKEMRKDVMKMALLSGTKGAHIGGGLSIIELLTVLYSDVMRYNHEIPDWEERDRLVLSKAHGAIGLYAALHYAGYLSDEEIDTAFIPGSQIYKHPKININKGFEFSGGSLGQGLSLAVGSAIALRNRGSKARIFVILGDGECDEGSIWEAVMCIPHFKLNSITVIIDRNKIQNDGTTEKVLEPGNLTMRFESLGYDVEEADGHDVIAVREAVMKECSNPKVIILNTVKGKGISFAENQVAWHMGVIDQMLYEQAMEELENA